jgi:hypothetical protein
LQWARGLVRRGRATRDLVAVAAVSAIAFGLRLHTALSPLETQDERNWMRRTVRFSDALHNGDFENASAVATYRPDDTITMPGVTTMWIGTLGRWAWAAGKRLGLWAGVNDPAYGSKYTYVDTRSGLQAAQIVMAVAVAALIGLLAFAVSRWVGSRMAGALVGVLVATEPFLVAHGAVLHTDELMSLFGVTALIFAALALGLPSTTSWTGKRWVAIVAGALAGGAVLTKLSALIFLLGVGFLFAWAKLAALRQHNGGDDVSDGIGGLLRRARPVYAAGAWWSAGFVLTVAAAYPALWFRPRIELRNVWRTTTLAGEGHAQFFLGETTNSPAATYYLVASPLRSTPWLLVGAVAAVTFIVWQRHTRGHGLVLLLAALPVMVTLSVAAKKFDRYGLPLMLFAAVAAGIASAPLLHDVRSVFDRRFSRVQLRHVLLVCTAGLILHGVSVSPWGMAYANPLLGGSSTAERSLLIGWGEGNEEIGKLIEEHAGGCDGVTVSGYPMLASYYRCGERSEAGEDGTYIIYSASERQRHPAYYRHRTKGREVVAVKYIRGLEYYEVFGPADPPAED